jgi:hypothetical protein
MDELVKKGWGVVFVTPRMQRENGSLVFRTYCDLATFQGYRFTQGKFFISGHRRIVRSSQRRDDSSSSHLSGEIPLREKRDGMTRQQQRGRFMCSFYTSDGVYDNVSR